MPKPTDTNLPGILLTMPLLLALAAGPAAADEPNPYYLGASQTFTYIDNIYNLSDRLLQLLPATSSANDTVSSTTLLAGIDQTWGRQRLYGNGRYSGNRYANNSQLNNDSYSADLALDWATVERLSGKVKLNASQNLAEFNFNTSGIEVTQKNVQNVAQADASIQIGQGTRFTGDAAIGMRNVRYTAPEYDFREYDQTSASAGMRYRPSGALTLGATYRYNRIDYPLFYVGTANPNDIETRQYLDLTAFWSENQISQFFLRVSPTRISYQQYTQRNDNEITGLLDWHWQATGKIKLITTLLRDAGQSSAFDGVNQGGSGAVGDYSTVTAALQVRAEYEFSSKVTFNGHIRLAQRQLANTESFANGSPITNTGTDDTTYLVLGGRWTPTRNSLVGCDLAATNRRTDNPALSIPYRGGSFGCFGQITLQ